MPTLLYFLCISYLLNTANSFLFENTKKNPTSSSISPGNGNKIRFNPNSKSSSQTFNQILTCSSHRDDLKIVSTQNYYQKSSVQYEYMKLFVVSLLVTSLSGITSAFVVIFSKNIIKWMEYNTNKKKLFYLILSLSFPVIYYFNKDITKVYFTYY